MNLMSHFLFGPFRPALEGLRPMLYRIAYAWCHDPALAEDLVQEALSKAWARRAQLREDAALKGVPAFTAPS